MGLRVLLVDDDPGIRALMRTYLETIPDLEVVEAQNGEDGKSALDESRFDLVISDYAMPRADGLDVLRHARGSELNGGTPFFLITSHDAELIVESALAEGATDFIPKPADRKGFLERVKKTLDVP